MTNIDFASYLPPLTARGVTTAQFVDAGDRMTAVLLDAKTGLPSHETGLREMATDVELAVRELDARLSAVRSSAFTARKKTAHENRLKCFTALRNGANGIVTDPDPQTAAAKRQWAAVVLEPVARLGAALREKTRAEASTALRLLFKECDKPEVQSALQETELLRFYELLKAAHAEYVRLLREEGRLEADGESAADAEPDAKSVVTDGSAPGAASKLGNVEAATVPVPTGLTQRQVKDGIVVLLETIFSAMAYHAAKGREPYRHLLARCRDMAQEINSDAKLRVTRAKKAEAKKAATGGQARTKSAGEAKEVVAVPENLERGSSLVAPGSANTSSSSPSAPKALPNGTGLPS
jgi:hypothetical protein